MEAYKKPSRINITSLVMVMVIDSLEPQLFCGFKRFL
jgi:hypothetical protein